jgi:hypothetical protein
MSQASTTNGNSTKVASGTADGLFAYLDFLLDKGYARTGTVSPWKSAARTVFSTVSGEKYGEMDVLELDVDDYLKRFENMVIGQYKEESLSAYRSRFKNSVESYRKYVKDKQLPTFKAASTRRSSRTAAGNNAAASTASNEAIAETGDVVHREPSGLIDYPFPLQTGQVAHLRLPMRLDKTDAERLGAFLRTLVFEPQKELTTGDEAEAQ